MTSIFETPILLIIFNRPDAAQHVFEQIRKMKPTQLFVAADGPRTNVVGEVEVCNQTRRVIENIDWDCEVNTFFRSENVGCGRGPSEAISWFFEHVEMGIILEDDCVPTLPFFDYCAYLLKKYKNNNQVWIISGRSHYPNKKFFKKQDYFFSNYAITWGWATWKRCWDNFEIDINKNWPAFYSRGGFKNIYFTKLEGAFRNLIYKRLQKDKDLVSHVWDFQFALNMALNRGLCVLPAKNLIENIGYQGTHFVVKTKNQKLKASDEFQILKEPTHILPYRIYERYYFRKDLSRRISAFIIHRILMVKSFLKIERSDV